MSYYTVDIKLVDGEWLDTSDVPSLAAALSYVESQKQKWSRQRGIAIDAVTIYNVRSHTPDSTSPHEVWITDQTPDNLRGKYWEVPCENVPELFMDRDWYHYNNAWYDQPVDGPDFHLDEDGNAETYTQAHNRYRAWWNNRDHK